MEKTTNWNELDKLPLYLELSRNQLASSIDQLADLVACKNSSRILDDRTVQGLIKVFTGQNKSTLVVIEQCHKWRKQNLSKAQLTNIKKLESYTNRLKETNSQISSIINNYCRDQTIDRIFKKEDLKLVLDFLDSKAAFTMPNRQQVFK